jgi:membrane-bound lytic murein transglycosylase B
MIAVLYALLAKLSPARRFLPIVVLVCAVGHATGQPAQSFDAFLVTLRAEAAAQGISNATFEAALTGVTPDGRVLAATRRQPEYGKPFGAYMESIVAPSRIAIGQRKLAQWSDTLRTVQTKFGVEPAIIVAIWGIESSFGGGEDRWDVFRSLATLAYAGFQQPYFHDELLSALKILQAGRVARRQFVGSWAGAMGQTQFMPSSYLKFAVDIDGDGRADIWTSVPDVLGSIANYLQKWGWQSGLPWGFEVVVPPGFDYRTSRGTFRQWTDRALKRADGGQMPDAGDAILFFPSGAAGPAFLVTANFIALKQYNNSDAYALAVAHLSDRMRGLGPIRAAWPAIDFQPSRAERIALQHKLADLGYKVRDFDGHFDFDLRDNICELQRQYGMIPDGHPSRAFMDRVGIRAP